MGGLGYECGHDGMRMLSSVGARRKEKIANQNGWNYISDNKGGFRMSLAELVLTAVALSMDALAVSVTYGMTMKHWDVGKAVRVAACFGAFQALMPALGWLAGMSVRDYIEAVDHWVAFVLLGTLGLKMVYDSLRGGEQAEAENRSLDNPRTLLLMAVATSIDALAVGISLALTRVNIGETAGVIGGITFVICLLGVGLGKRAGGLLQKHAGLVGGLILVGIGVKVLVEHLMAG